MLTIENPFIKAKINFKGAELCSLVDKESQTEYIWQGDPHWWARHSPVLFPIVGRLKDDEFSYHDSFYGLSQHGFARDLNFSVITYEQDSVSLQLKADQNTRMFYPFHFVLNISYELQDKSIHVKWEVINEDKQKMWFSIGAHPAFNVPVIDGDKKEDYFLLFEPEEVPEIYRIEKGLRNGEKEAIHLVNNQLHLTHGLFDQDALIFKNPVSTAISICRGNIKFLTLHHEGFSWLGIWSKNDACPFVCLEPWMGVADQWDHHKNIEKKESILSLEKGAHFKKGYRIEIC